MIKFIKLSYNLVLILIFVFLKESISVAMKFETDLNKHNKITNKIKNKEWKTKLDKTSRH